MAELRRRCPMSGRTYQLALERGLLSDQADRWAVACGLHPSLVWLDWFDEVMVECADRSCTNLLIQYRSNQKYCSRLCGNRDRQRVYLAAKRADPEFRRAETERMRQYRSAAVSRVAARKHRERNRDAVNAYKREYRARIKAAGCTPSPPHALSGEVAA